MKSSTVVTTKKTYQLNAQELMAILRDRKMIPDGWEYFAVDVQSSEDKKELTVVLERTEAKP